MCTVSCLCWFYSHQLQLYPHWLATHWRLALKGRTTPAAKNRLGLDSKDESYPHTTIILDYIGLYYIVPLYRIPSCIILSYHFRIGIQSFQPFLTPRKQPHLVLSRSTTRCEFASWRWKFGYRISRQNPGARTWQSRHALGPCRGNGGWKLEDLKVWGRAIPIYLYSDKSNTMNILVLSEFEPFEGWMDATRKSVRMIWEKPWPGQPQMHW